MRILVVDDDDVVGRSIARMLKGHDVQFESNPARAVERIESGEWFDLVLCDLHMPTSSGIEVIDRVKAWFGSDAPVCVLMSGDDVVDTSHADAYLLKPFELSEVRGLATHAEELRSARCTEPTRVVRVTRTVA